MVSALYEEMRSFAELGLTHSKLSFKQFLIQWLAIGVALPLVLTIVLLLTSCAGTAPLLPASPIDLIKAKTIPVRDSIVFPYSEP